MLAVAAGTVEAQTLFNFFCNSASIASWIQMQYSSYPLKGMN